MAEEKKAFKKEHFQRNVVVDSRALPDNKLFNRRMAYNMDNFPYRRSGGQSLKSGVRL